MIAARIIAQTSADDASTYHRLAGQLTARWRCLGRKPIPRRDVSFAAAVASACANRCTLIIVMLFHGWLVRLVVNPPDAVLIRKMRSFARRCRLVCCSICVGGGTVMVGRGGAGLVSWHAIFGSSPWWPPAGLADDRPGLSETLPAERASAAAASTFGNFATIAPRHKRVVMLASGSASWHVFLARSLCLHQYKPRRAPAHWHFIAEHRFLSDDLSTAGCGGGGALYVPAPGWRIPRQFAMAGWWSARCWMCSWYSDSAAAFGCVSTAVSSNAMAVISHEFRIAAWSSSLAGTSPFIEYRAIAGAAVDGDFLRLAGADLPSCASASIFCIYASRRKLPI